MKYQTKHLFAILLGSFVIVAQLAAQDDDEIFILSPFEISASSESGYRVGNVVSAGLIEQQIYDIPIPLQVLDDKLLSDFNTDDFHRILQYTPGVQQTSTGTHGADFRVRGYQSRALRNGFFVFAPPVTSNIERIEVAKGPSSVLYGLGATGGVVNRLSKSPQFKDAGSLYVGTGSDGYFRSLLDVTGPIGNSEKVAFRLIADHFRYESDVDFEETDRSAITPSLRFLPTKNIILNFEYEEQAIRDTPEMELPVLSDADTGGDTDRAKISRGGTVYTYNEYGPDSWRDIDTSTFTAEATIFLSEAITFNAAIFDTSLHSDEGLLRDTRTPNGNTRFEIDNRVIDNEAYRASFLFNWNIGEDILVKTVLGYDDREERPTRIGRRRRANQEGLVFNADTLTAPGHEVALVRAEDPFRFNPRRITAQGTRLTNTISAMDGKLHAILGVRQDESETESLRNGSKTDGDDTTHQLGFIYEFREGVSFFANSSSSYAPNGQLDRNGNTFAPQTGDGFDVGFKFLGVDGKFSGEITYFDLSRENVAVRINIADDPSTPDIDERESFFEISGEENSKGFEFVFAYDPVDHLQLLLSGSFYDPKVVSDANDPRRIGLEPEDQVSSSLSFLTTYTREDWDFGMSVNWRDDAPTQSRYDRRNVRTDDYVLVNLFAKYRFKMMDHDAEFSVNIDNALDKREYINIQGSFGQPLQAKAGLKVFF